MQDTTEPIYFYESNKNVLVFNYTPFYRTLSDVHTGIDAIHDQMDTSRGCSKLASNKIYKQRIKNAIISASISNDGSFSTSKGTYNLNQSAHTLSTALDRPTFNNTFNIQVNGQTVSRDDLPSYMKTNEHFIMDQNTTSDVIRNTHLEIVKYEPDDREVSANTIGSKYGVTDTHYVLDCGPKTIFANLTAQNGRVGTSTSVFSGILDSSSSNERISQIREHYQVFIPFMKLSADHTIMLYATPDIDDAGTYVIHMAFTVLTNTEIGSYQNALYSNKRTKNISYSTGNFVSKQISSIPSLPDISQYLGAELYNGYKPKCVDFLMKTNTAVIWKACEPFREIVDDLIKTLPKSFVFDRPTLMIQFFILIKHFGDRFRAIDAVILSKNVDDATTCLTGTSDTFLMRFISLSKMHGCYVNIHNNLILHNIKQLTDSEIQIIAQKQADAKLKMIQDKIDFINQVNTDIKQPTVISSIQIFNQIQNKFSEYFTNMKIYAPRGRLIRKLVSCVASKKFVVSGTNIVFDESDIQTVWKCFQIFRLLLACYNQQGTRDNVTSKPSYFTTGDGEELIKEYYNTASIRHDILNIIKISNLNNITNVTTSIPIVDISHRICNIMKLKDRIAIYKIYMKEPFNFNSEWILNVNNVKIGGNPQIGGNLNTYIDELKQIIKRNPKNITINVTRSRTFISYHYNGSPFNMNIHWLFEDFQGIATYLYSMVDTDNTLYDALSLLYEQIRLHYFYDGMFEPADTNYNVSDNIIQETDEDDYNLIYTDFTLHHHFSILVNVIKRAFEIILPGSTMTFGETIGNISGGEKKIDSTFDFKIDKKTMKSQFSLFTRLSREAALAQNTYIDNDYQNKKEYIEMLKTKRRLTRFYATQYNIKDNVTGNKDEFNKMMYGKHDNITEEKDKAYLTAELKDFDKLIKQYEQPLQKSKLPNSTSKKVPMLKSHIVDNDVMKSERMNFDHPHQLVAPVAGGKIKTKRKRKPNHKSKSKSKIHRKRGTQKRKI